MRSRGTGRCKRSSRAPAAPAASSLRAAPALLGADNMATPAMYMPKLPNAATRSARYTSSPKAAMPTLTVAMRFIAGRRAPTVMMTTRLIRPNMADRLRGGAPGAVCGADPDQVSGGAARHVEMQVLQLEQPYLVGMIFIKCLERLIPMIL